jgi:hypothetical protein
MIMGVEGDDELQRGCKFAWRKVGAASAPGYLLATSVTTDNILIYN